MSRAMRHSHQLTLRNLDPRLEREIRALAKRERISPTRQRRFCWNGAQGSLQSKTPTASATASIT